MSAQPAPSFVDFPARLKQFTDVLDAFEWQLLCGLRVACPATIESFDAQKQTATVQLSLRENILQNLVPTPVTIAPLVDVPVVMFRAGGASITMPIGIGDECLVIFADMCIDGWWQAGGVQNQLDRRRHDLSDAFAIVGIWNQTRVLPNYSTTSIQIRSDNGQTMVEVDPTGTVNIVAATQVNISGSGQTIIEGKDFLLHKHTGVQTGGGTSGPVL